MVKLINKDEIFKRLDAINAEIVPLREIERLEKEGSKLNIDFHTYTKYGQEWVASRFPDIPAEGRRRKLAEFYGFGARKAALFKRLDAIESGKVPVEQIGLRKEEAEKVNMAENRYMGCALEWVANRHPEIPPEQRRAKLREFYGIGPRKKALFQRLDAITTGQIQVKEVGTLDEEQAKMNLSRNAYKKFGTEWVALRYPNVPAENRYAKFTECFGFGARKAALFNRLDAIAAEKVPLEQIGDHKEEAAAFDMSPFGYTECGIEWLQRQDPKLPREECLTKIQAFYGYGARKAALFKRWDAMDERLVPVKDIGTNHEEAVKQGVSFIGYRHAGIEWVGIRHPEVLPGQKLAKFSEYYGNGARKTAVFKRLDAIDKGKVPPEEITTLKKEAEMLDISIPTYVDWGKEWLELTHPEVPPAERMRKLGEYHGRKAREKAGFIDKKTQEVLQTVTEQINAYKSGKKILTLREIWELHKTTNTKVSRIIRKKLHQMFEAQGKTTAEAEQAAKELFAAMYPEVHQIYDKETQRILPDVLDQFKAYQGGKGILTLKALAKKNKCSNDKIARIMRRVLREYFEKMGKSPRKAEAVAEDLFIEIYPQWERTFAGQQNHVILEYGLRDVFNARCDEHNGVKLDIEKPEGNYRHDVLLKDVQINKWLESRLKEQYTNGKTFLEILQLTPDQVAQYDRISIDFQPWEDGKKSRGKATKYASTRTLLLITLTGHAPDDIEYVKVLPEFPHTRVVTVEVIFRLLHANTAALEKMRKCCALTRQGKLGELIQWKRQIKRGTAPPFTEGQQSLDTWGISSREKKPAATPLDFAQMILFIESAVKQGQFTPQLANYLKVLRERGHIPAADFLEGVARDRARRRLEKSSADHGIEGGSRGPEHTTATQSDSNITPENDVGPQNRKEARSGHEPDETSQDGANDDFAGWAPESGKDTGTDSGTDQEEEEDPDSNQDPKDKPEPKQDSSGGMDGGLDGGLDGGIDGGIDGEGLMGDFLKKKERRSFAL